MQITVVTCAPTLTTHADDSPFPKTAASPSCVEGQTNLSQKQSYDKLKSNKYTYIFSSRSY